MIPASESAYYEHVRRTGAFDEAPRLLWHLLKPGSVLIDLGSNLGAVSIPLAKKGVEVFSLDALPQNVVLLEAAKRENGLNNLKVFNKAVWSAPKKLRIGGHEAWGRVSARGAVKVEAVRLDDFVLANKISRIDALKIDIEGAELEALAGMKRVLTEIGPDVVIEANVLTCGAFGYSIHDLFSTLEGHGYHLFRMAGWTLIPFASGDFQETICCDYLATKCTADVGQRAAPWQVHEAREMAAALIAFMKTMASAGPDHQRYMAHVAPGMPESFRGDEELAVLINTWRDAPLNDSAVHAIEVGSRHPATNSTPQRGWWRSLTSRR